MNNTNKRIKLITHNADFHADDVFATAALMIYLEKENKDYEIIRTRDEEMIKTANYVYDVGGIYDADINRFDHHQIEDGPKPRINGIPYAAFGLIWKHFGEKISGNKEVADVIENKLVMPIDANDNALLLYTPVIEDIYDYDIANVIRSFIPSQADRTEETLYESFLEAVSFAKKILNQEILKISEKLSFRDIVVSIYEKSGDKRLIILPTYYPWKDFLKFYKEPLFVITPRENGMYQIKTVPEGDAHLFKNRKDFPKEWAGLRDEELQKISRVNDAVFCHKNLFLAVAKSKEGALKLAELALEY